MRKQAIFETEGGVSVVLWILREDDVCLYVTDDNWLTETDTLGITRRVLAMPRRKAYLHNPLQIEHGQAPNLAELLAFLSIALCIKII
jgi:hypothetical protein